MNGKHTHTHPHAPYTHKCVCVCVYADRRKFTGKKRTHGTRNTHDTYGSKAFSVLSIHSKELALRAHVVCCVGEVADGHETRTKSYIYMVNGARGRTFRMCFVC